MGPVVNIEKLVVVCKYPWLKNKQTEKKKAKSQTLAWIGSVMGLIVIGFHSSTLADDKS